MDKAAIVQLKGALMEVTSARGWEIVQKAATQHLQAMKDKSFIEEDPLKAEGLRRDARGAMLFWQELNRSIELTKNLDLDPQDTFLDVATE